MLIMMPERFKKILQEGKITLITTPTIIGCFLRKYSALAQLEINFLKTVFKFKPAKIGEMLSFHGGKLKFFYTLHSIPCVGFEAYYGGKSIIFSGDHMNDPSKIEDLYKKGILTKGRKDDLLNFPWYKHDLILHEAGIPPIHTPIETLVALDDEIKKKLYLVHVSLKSIPENQGLKTAKVGVENTIVIENVIPPPYSEQLLKIDLITNLEIFSDLKLKYVADIFTSAKVETYKKGQYILTKGEETKFFYILQSGIAQVRIERTKSFDNPQQQQQQEQRPRTQSTPISDLTCFSSSDRTQNYSDVSLGQGIDTKFGQKYGQGQDEKQQMKKRSQYRRKKSSVVGSMRTDQPSTSRTRNRRNNGGGLDIFTKTYYPGDIFGEKCLLSEYDISTENIVSLTKVTLLKCDKETFLSILQEDNKILKKLRNLENLRERGTLDVIECNSTLRLFSHSQKTQLESCFFRKKFKKDSIIWKENDPCKFAIVISSGDMTFTEQRTIYKRRGSGVLLDDQLPSRKPSNSLPDVSFNHHNSQPESESSILSPSHIHVNDTKLANELMLDVDREPVERVESETYVQSIKSQRGAFIGDVDGLFYNGYNRVGLKCLTDVSVYCLMKDDLQKFFKKNPGVLLSMMHTQFIT